MFGKTAVAMYFIFCGAAVLRLLTPHRTAPQ
jgi:hypothetical protein